MKKKEIIWRIFQASYWPMLSYLTARWVFNIELNFFNSLILIVCYIIGGTYLNFGLVQISIREEQDRIFEKCKRKYGILKTVHIVRYYNYYDVPYNKETIEERSKKLKKEAKEVTDYINDVIHNKQVNEEQEEELKKILIRINKLLKDVRIQRDEDDPYY